LPPLFFKTLLTEEVNAVGFPFCRTVEVPTHQSEEEIKREMEGPALAVQTVGYRPLTELENLAFIPMIDPFEPGQVREKWQGDPYSSERVIREKVISYGLSSFGYDIRCADEFKVFTNINSTVVDPKNFDPQSFVEVSGKGYCVIPPNSFALARTVEYFRIPRDVMTVCLGKSTYARCGIVVNVTPFEPEWEGYVTLEFSNTTPLPAKIYANEGCAQVLFLQGLPCEVSYNDRNGKYQKQEGVVPPKV
jgi:dCTP deaminase